MERNKKEEIVDEGQELCEKCGSQLVDDENGFKYCPNCDASIDFFGDDDE